MRGYGNSRTRSKANINSTVASRSFIIRLALVATTMMMIGCRQAGNRGRNFFLGRSVANAFVTRSHSRIKKNVNRFDALPGSNRPTPFTAKSIRLRSSRSDGYDDAGRRVRTPRPSADSWGDDDDDDWGQPSSNRRGSNRSSRSSSRSDDSWDDFDPWDEPKQPQRRRGSSNNDFDDDDGWGSPRGRSSGRQRYDSSDNDDGFDDDWGAPRERPRREQHGGRGGRGRGRGGGRGGRGRGRDSEGRGGGNRNSRKGNKKKGDDSSADSRSINMNALEGAGFVHLYGLSSVLNALSTGRRDLTTSMEKTDTEAVDTSRFEGLGGWENDEDDEDFGTSRGSSRQESVKPQAQFRPYLFVLDRRSSGSDRRGSKASAAQEVLKLAEERDVPIAHVDKGILNVLSGNRPHQGFALRCGKLYFESLSRIPMPTNARGGSESSPSLWLVLDEVVDPQNLGALLRSAYFLGGKKNNVGVLVCSKNSAPPSPVVSASSAGALEVVDVHSTTNLPRTLNQARDDGFRIIGASVDVPNTGAEEAPPLYDLQDLPVRNPDGDDRPILLVLGSEGHGLRTLVAKACTEFVKIPSGMGDVESTDDEDDNDSEAGVDSLNVSVSAGIMLWHLIHAGK